MEDQEKSQEQLIAELQAAREKITRLQEREDRRRSLLSNLTRIGWNLLNHLTSVGGNPRLLQFGTWKWNVKNDEVIFQIWHLHSGGKRKRKRVETKWVEKRVKTKWAEIIHSEDFGRTSARLDSFLDRLTVAGYRRLDLTSRDLASGDYSFTFRTVSNSPMFAECKAVLFAEPVESVWGWTRRDVETVLGDFVDAKELVKRLGFHIDSPDSFELDLAKQFVEKFIWQKELFSPGQFLNEMAHKYADGTLYFLDKNMHAHEMRERADDVILHGICSVPDPAFFVQGSDGRYTYVNPTMTRLLGIPESEILGKTDRELFDGRLGWQYEAGDRGIRDASTIAESVYEKASPELQIEEPGWVSYNIVRRIDGKAPSDLVIVTCRRGRSHWKRLTYWGVAWEHDETATAYGPTAGEIDNKSKAMQAAMESIHLATQSESAILLRGETGVGKDYWARFIHDHSDRADEKYFPINCAAIAPNLAESELFGHERGAFTGAAGKKRGLLEMAEGGTLLLNEIGELPLPLQAKLLTFLDTREFTRVGGEKNISVTARLIAATNKDLEEAVESEIFRKDLYYRLSVVSISIAPLRDRLDEIPILVQELLPTIMSVLHIDATPIVTPAAIDAMKRYDWPGNVRELRNVLERALFLSKGKTVDVMYLGFPHSSAQALPSTAEVKATAGVGTNWGQSCDSPISMTKIVRPDGYAGKRPKRPSPEYLAMLKKDHIDSKGWSITHLANQMGVDRSTLSKWLKNVGLSESFSSPKK
jgi:transcriptional regulator with PAS, ATPase and Fis domain